MTDERPLTLPVMNLHEIAIRDKLCCYVGPGRNQPSRPLNKLNPNKLAPL